MSCFNVFLIGSSQSLPLQIDAENLQSLTALLTHQRFLIGRFTDEAEGMSQQSVMIPVSRINMLYQVE